MSLKPKPMFEPSKHSKSGHIPFCCLAFFVNLFLEAFFSITMAAWLVP